VFGALAALAGLLTLGPTPDAGAPIPLPLGRTTTVVVTPALGTAVERAVPGAAFAAAAALDAEQRWGEAAAAYQQAIAEWSDASRLRPSAALDRAIQKAERERQRSLLLASTRPTRGRFESVATSINPLEEGRLLRAKLMIVRAARGRAPVDLVARARAAFEEALRLAGPSRADAEARLLLCATRAAAGDHAGARLERARVATAERHDLDNALALAVCAAALGEDDEAMARLEIALLRPMPHPLDPYSLRDLYLANDWDRLRGTPRFETLFAAALPP
jgi:hypothetical protein